MRLLHTADWHLGKRLYGVERIGESEAVLAELAELAAAERPDAILVAGDLLERRLVDSACLGLCLRSLERLAEVAPVVAIAGNHDDPDLWEHLAPYLAHRRITVRGRPRRPEEAVVDLETAAGPLHVAALPWLDPARLGLEAGIDRRGAHGGYADGVAAMLEAYAAELRARRAADGGPAVLLGHLMIDRAEVGGGERELTLGTSYAVTASAVPTDLDYVALGHVHRPQPLPGIAASGRYAGSPLALDFSEDNHAKSAALAEIGAGRTVVRELAIAAGRPLARIRGPLEELPALAAAHPSAWLYCEVELERVTLDLVREVRGLVPDALRIEPRYPEDPARDAEDPGGEAGAQRSLADHYGDWHASEGRPLDPRQADAFAQALERAAEVSG